MPFITKFLVLSSILLNLHAISSPYISQMSFPFFRGELSITAYDSSDLFSSVVSLVEEVSFLFLFIGFISGKLLSIFSADVDATGSYCSATKRNICNNFMQLNYFTYQTFQSHFLLIFSFHWQYLLYFLWLRLFEVH